MAVSEISVVDLARRTMYPRRQLASRFVNLASLFSPGNREEDRLVLVLPPFVFICPFAARRAVIRINLPDNRLLLRRRIYHHSLSFTESSFCFSGQTETRVFVFLRILFSIIARIFQVVPRVSDDFSPIRLRGYLVVTSAWNCLVF